MAFGSVWFRILEYVVERRFSFWVAYAKCFGLVVWPVNQL